MKITDTPGESKLNDSPTALSGFCNIHLHLMRVEGVQLKTAMLQFQQGLRGSTKFKIKIAASRF